MPKPTKDLGEGLLGGVKYDEHDLGSTDSSHGSEEEGSVYQRLGGDPGVEPPEVPIEKVGWFKKMLLSIGVGHSDLKEKLIKEPYDEGHVENHDSKPGGGYEPPKPS